MLVVGFNTHDKMYSHEETITSFSYYIKSQWSLKLKEQGSFELKFKGKDSRRPGEQSPDFVGSWENNNDTITLKVISPLPDDCFITTAKFITSNSVLKST